MKLVIGLGNPGPKYAGTRHNIGYEVVNYLASAPSVGAWKSRFQSLVAETSEAGEQILLIKPETFMNLSGRAVRQAIDFYKLGPADLLVICDDLALPSGKLRLRATGSHGGQNGLRNIQDSLGTPDYPRLRIGIDSPGEHQDAADYVLGRFKASERSVIDDAVAKAARAVLTWSTRGIDAAMNLANGGEQRPPKPKPEKKAGDRPKESSVEEKSGQRAATEEIKTVKP